MSMILKLYNSENRIAEYDPFMGLYYVEGMTHTDGTLIPYKVEELLKGTGIWKETGPWIVKDCTHLGVVGGRTFDDFGKLYEEIDRLRLRYPSIDTIVSGGAKKGGDLGAKFYAESRGLKYDEYPADWSDMSEPCTVGYKGGKKFNRLAGFNRNGKIAHGSDVILAAWDGESKGTADTMAKAGIIGIPVHVLNY